MDAISDDLNLVVTDISSAGQFWIEKIRNNINPKLTDLKNLVELTPRVQLDWLRQTFTAHVSSAKHLLEITYKIVGLCVQAEIIDEVFDELIGMRRVSFSKTDNVSTICVLCNIISDFLNDITLQSEFDVLTDAIVSVLSTRNVGIHSKRITIWFYSRAADQIDKKTNSKLFRSSKQLVNAQQMFESISKFHLSTEAIAYEALWHESILSYLSISQILIKNTNTLNELVRFTEVLNAAEFLNGFEKFSGSAQSDEPNEQIDKLEHTLANVSSLIMDLRMKLTELDKSTDDIGICSAAYVNRARRLFSRDSILGQLLANKQCLKGNIASLTFKLVLKHLVNNDLTDDTVRFLEIAAGQFCCTCIPFSSIHHANFKNLLALALCVKSNKGLLETCLHLIENMFKFPKQDPNNTDCLNDFYIPLFRFCLTTVDSHFLEDSAKLGNHFQSESVIEMLNHVFKVSEGYGQYISDIIIVPFLKADTKIKNIKIACRILNYWETIMGDNLQNVVTVVRFLENRIHPILNHTNAKDGATIRLLTTAIHICRSHPMALKDSRLIEFFPFIIQCVIELPNDNSAYLIDECINLLLSFQPGPTYSINLTILFDILNKNDPKFIVDLLPSTISWIAHCSLKKLHYDDLSTISDHSAMMTIYESENLRKQLVAKILHRIDVLSSTNGHFKSTKELIHLPSSSIYAPSILSFALMFISKIPEKDQWSPKILKWIYARCCESKLHCHYFHHQDLHNVVLYHYSEIEEGDYGFAIYEKILMSRINENDLKHIFKQIKDDDDHRSLWLNLLHKIACSAKFMDARHYLIFGNGYIPLFRPRSEMLVVQRSNEDSNRFANQSRSICPFDPFSQELTISLWIRMAPEFCAGHSNDEILHVISAKFPQNTLSISIQSNGKLIINVRHPSDSSTVALPHQASKLTDDWTHVIVCFEIRRTFTIYVNNQKFTQNITLDNDIIITSPMEISCGVNPFNADYENTFCFQLSRFIILNHAINEKEACVLHNLGPVRFNFLSTIESEQFEYVELRFNTQFKNECSSLCMPEFREIMKLFADTFLMGWSARTKSVAVCRELKVVRTKTFEFDNAKTFKWETPSAMHILLRIGGIPHFMYLYGFIVDNHSCPKMQSIALTILLDSVLKNSLLHARFFDMDGIKMILRLLIHEKASISIDILKPILLFLTGSTSNEEVRADNNMKSWITLNSHLLVIINSSDWITLLVRNYIWIRDLDATRFLLDVYNFMLSEASPFSEFNRSILFQGPICKYLLLDIQDSVQSKIPVSQHTFEILAEYIEDMAYEADFTKTYYKMLVSICLRVIQEKSILKKSRIEQETPEITGNESSQESTKKNFKTLRISKGSRYDIEANSAERRQRSSTFSTNIQSNPPNEPPTSFIEPQRRIVTRASSVIEQQISLFESLASAFHTRIRSYTESEMEVLIEMMSDRSFVVLMMSYTNFENAHGIRLVMHLLKYALTQGKLRDIKQNEVRCLMTLVGSQLRSLGLSIEIFNHCYEFCDLNDGWACDTLPIFYGICYAEVDSPTTYEKVLEYIFDKFSRFDAQKRQICVCTGFLQWMLKTISIERDEQYDEMNSKFAYGISLLFFCNNDNYFTFNWYLAALSQIYIQKTNEKNNENSRRYVEMALRTIVTSIEAVLDLIMCVLFDVHPNYESSVDGKERTTKLDRSSLIKKFSGHILDAVGGYSDWVCYNIADFFKWSSDVYLHNDQQAKNISLEAPGMDEAMLRLFQCSLMTFMSLDEFKDANDSPYSNSNVFTKLKFHNELIGCSIKKMFYLLEQVHRHNIRLSMLQLLSNSVVDLYSFFNSLQMRSNDEHTERINCAIDGIVQSVNDAEFINRLREIKSALNRLESSSRKWVSDAARTVNSLSLLIDQELPGRSNVTALEKEFRKLTRKDFNAVSQHSSDAISLYKRGLHAAKIIQKEQDQLTTDYKRDRLQMCYEGVMAWRLLVSHLIHDCALWSDKKSEAHFWQLNQSASENGERRRLKRCKIGANFDAKFILPEHRWKLESEKFKRPLHFLRKMLGGFDEYFDDAFIQALQACKSVRFHRRCSRIRPEYVVEGVILIYSDKVNFMGLRTKEDKGCKVFERPSYDVSDCFISFRSDQIKQMFRRRYTLSNVAVEVFLTTGDAHVFTFESMEDRESFWGNVMAIEPKYYENPITVDKVQRQWVDGQLSNFEYLLLLNRYSGRSFNDLLQYPVFPHILAEYASEQIDLDDPKVYRRLEKPIAIQHREQEEKFIKCFMDLQEKGYSRMSMLIRPGPYHYASVYSNMSIVLQYLIRVIPYTGLFINYQDGDFDIADRCFHSLRRTYISLTRDSNSDFKELVPEFFYFHEFLQNRQGFDYGRRQNGQQIDEVEVPPWCSRNARLFVMIHRQALESDFVTRNLHGWIDLIFGYNQQGKNATRAINLYHPACYYGFDFGNCPSKSIFNVLMEIGRSYGQIPLQLFHNPHPVHKSNPQSLRYKFPEESIHSRVIGLSWGDYVGSLKYNEGIQISSTSQCPAPIIDFYSFDNRIYGLANTYLHMTESLRSNGHGDEAIKQDPITIAYDKKTSLLILSELDKSTICRHNLPTNLGLATTCSSYENHIFIGYQCGIIVTYIVESKGLKSGIRRLGIPFMAHDSSITCLKVCSSFRIMISGDDVGRIAMWDLALMEYIQSRTFVDRRMVAVDVSRTTGDFGLISEFADGRWRLDLFTCNLDQVAALDAEKVFGNDDKSPFLTAIAFTNAPEGVSVNCIVGGFDDGSLRFWSTYDLTLLRVSEITLGSPIIAIGFNCARDKMFVSTRNCQIFAVTNKQRQQ